MTQLPFWTRLQMRADYKPLAAWLFPMLCVVPYLAILFWLLSRGLIWISQVLLAPLLMGVLALLTL